MLGRMVSPSAGHEVLRHRRECGKRATEIASCFSQHDLVSAAKDFHLVDMKAKLLRQAYCLAIAGLEDTGGAHEWDLVFKYIPYVYTLKREDDKKATLTGKTVDEGLAGETNQEAQAQARYG